MKEDYVIKGNGEFVIECDAKKVPMESARRLALYTEHILRPELIAEVIKTRQEIGYSQKKLEELSGVKQPIIARMEKGQTSPQVDTLLKLLAAMGKTLAIVSLDDEERAVGT